MCNSVETRVDGELIDATWHDCNNANCPTSNANPNNQ